MRTCVCVWMFSAVCKCAWTCTCDKALTARCQRSPSSIAKGRGWAPSIRPAYFKKLLYNWCWPFIQQPQRQTSCMWMTSVQHEFSFRKWKLPGSRLQKYVTSRRLLLGMPFFVFNKTVLNVWNFNLFVIYTTKSSFIIIEEIIKANIAAPLLLAKKKKQRNKL